MKLLCVSETQSHQLNTLRPSDAYMRGWTNHHWFRYWLVAYPTSSHYLNQCWNIVNWTLGNKLQWNINRNLYISIEENAFENGVWKMAATVPRPQWVNQCWLIHWTLRNKLQWNLNKNAIISIQEVTFPFKKFAKWQPFRSGLKSVNLLISVAANITTNKWISRECRTLNFCIIISTWQELRHQFPDRHFPHQFIHRSLQWSIN